MRILVTSRGSSGHLTPLAPFAHAAMRAGHHVLAAVQEPHRENARRLGLPSVTVQAAPPERWKPLMASFARLDLETANRTMVTEYFGRLDTEAALPELLRLVEEWRPDVILRESWEFASTIAGEVHGVPVVRGGLGLGVIEELTDELMPPVLDPIRADAGLAPDPDGHALRDAPYLTMVPELLEDPDAPAPRDVHRHRHPVREEAITLPSRWWPGRGADPLVYVSFGSVAGGSGLPYFPSLYRRVADALDGFPARVLLTLGQEPDPAALGPLPANVHAARWVPQDAVLSRAAMTVTHGGHGSTLGALAHGVPAVVVPLFSIDQWANAAAVERAGAGIALDEDRATRQVLAAPRDWVLDGLRPAVEQVLADPEYTRAARRVAGAMAALPGPDAALDTLLAVAA
jgi:UDP:flavonoid glycosyltransferase YjiC (YdhE family)